MSAESFRFSVSVEELSSEIAKMWFKHRNSRLMATSQGEVLVEGNPDHPVFCTYLDINGKPINEILNNEFGTIANGTKAVEGRIIDLLKSSDVMVFKDKD